MNSKANSSSIESSHQAHFKARRVTGRSHKPSYGLTDAEITPELGQELADFYRFMTSVGVEAPSVKSIVAVTANNYLTQVRLLLGWMHRHRTPVVPLSHLRLSELFFPNGLRAEEASQEEATCLPMANVEDYLQWLRVEREVAPSYELQVVKALVWVVRFLESVSTHQASKHPSRRETSRWEETVLKELRSLMSDIQAQGKTTPRVANDAAKWIDWPEFLNCVKQLKAECTPINKSNQQRSNSAIATSIQRYLIFAFFSAIPVRPRTVRELELGRTLVKRDEVWYLELEQKNFKTSETHSKLGEKRFISIPQ